MTQPLVRPRRPAIAPAARPQAAAIDILHVAQGGGHSNGLRMAVYELSRAQAMDGHHVTLQLCGADRFEAERVRGEAEQVRVMEFPLRGHRSLGFSPKGERWIGSSSAANVGVVHQHGIWSAHSRITNRWRARHGGPTVITPHGSLEPVALGYSRWKKSLALAAYERHNLHAASCLQATAEQEVAGFRDFGLRNPVAVISNGVSEAWIHSIGDGSRFRSAHGVPESSRVMLYLSRIHPKKNLLGLVETLARMGARMNDWHLAIVGPEDDHAYGDRIRRAIAEGGLASRVHWTGELIGQDKRDAFAAAELMVLPTLSDNFAIVVVEALGAGVPVLTTHGALPWELLEEHECGWWVPCTTWGLLGALQQAMSLPSDALSMMGRRGRHLVEHEFRWDDIAGQTARLYEWLLGRGPRPDFVVVD